MDWILCAGDPAHGVVEGEAEDLNEKINGISCHIALGPAPVGVFYDEAGIGGQNIIARLLCDELECLFLQERYQRSQAGDADLFTRPACLMGVGCHSLFSSGVG